MRLSLRTAATYAYWVCAATILIVVGGQRLELARTASLRCDELPLLMNSTGLCGQATNETEARAFEPSLFTFRRGLIRSLRPPTPPASLQTSAAFGAHVGIHLLGYSPLAARLWPLGWSMVALIATAWGVRRAGGGRIAVLAAMVMIGLSPLANVYAAQTRGYSESVYAAALLLAGMAYGRERPRSWAAWLLVSLACVQSALSVYTTWVYWSVPVLIAAWLHAGLGMDQPDRRAYVRALACVTVAVILWVGLYTVDRVDVLLGQATSMGRPMTGLADAASFAREFIHDVAGPGAWMLVGAPLGMVALWRGRCRWWLTAVGLSLASIACAAAILGSAGYVRNVLFLLAPMAIVSALGIEKLAGAMARAVWHKWSDKDPACGRATSWIRRWTAPAIIVVLAASAVGWTAASFAQAGRTARQWLPDWGRAAARVEAWQREGESCWLLRCEAFHRVIDWYGAPEGDAAAAMLTALNGVAGAGGPIAWSSDVSKGTSAIPLDARSCRSIRIVLPAQRDAHGQPQIFRTNPRPGVIEEGPLPSYLAQRPPIDVVEGIELRTWRAMPLDSDLRPGESGGPALIVVNIRDNPKMIWRRMCEEAQAFDHGVVPFAPFDLHDGSRLLPLMAPGDMVSELARVLDSVRVEGEPRYIILNLVPDEPALRGEGPS